MWDDFVMVVLLRLVNFPFINKIHVSPLYAKHVLFLFLCLMVFNATLKYFNYIVVVSFIGRGNRRTRRKPPNCRKSLTNFIT
jgi:hypothetical protein